MYVVFANRKVHPIPSGLCCLTRLLFNSKTLLTAVGFDEINLLDSIFKIKINW